MAISGPGRVPPQPFAGTVPAPTTLAVEGRGTAVHAPDCRPHAPVHPSCCCMEIRCHRLLYCPCSCVGAGARWRGPRQAHLHWHQPALGAHDASMPRCLRLRPQPHASDFFLISPAFVRTTRAPSPFCPLALALGLASYAVHTTNCRMPGRDLIGTVSETTRGLWCEVGAEGGQRGGSC